MNTLPHRRDTASTSWTHGHRTNAIVDPLQSTHLAEPVNKATTKVNSATKGIKKPLSGATMTDSRTRGRDSGSKEEASDLSNIQRSSDTTASASFSSPASAKRSSQQTQQQPSQDLDHPLNFGHAVNGQSLDGGSSDNVMDSKEEDADAGATAACGSDHSRLVNGQERGLQSKLATGWLDQLRRTEIATKTCASHGNSCGDHDNDHHQDDRQEKQQQHAIDAYPASILPISQGRKHDYGLVDDAASISIIATTPSLPSLAPMATTTTTTMPYLQDSTATDNERDAERAVQGPLTGNAKVTGDHQQDEDEDEEGQERQQRCSRPLHPSRQPSSRIHTMSTPARPKQHRPLEHLADLGPLGAVRDEKIDVLGAEAVVLPGQEPSLSTELSVATNLVHSNKSAPSTLEQQQQPLDRLSHCPSSSTLVSESSHTSQSTAESFSKKTADHGTEAEGLVWSGVHPLLMDYSSEPGLMDEVDNDCYDDERDNGQDKPPAHLQRRSESTRNANKDVGQPQGHGSHWNTSAGGIDTVAGGFAGTRRRRRNVSKADDSRSWTSNEERDVGGHSSNDTTESDGKRVIIHQVAVTDTLAGIALYYGIQVPILKKSNKLWTNDSIHTRKYLYIPFEECTVARKAGVMVDENNQTVILPQRVQQQQQQQQHSSSHNTSESIVASHGNAGPTSLPSSFANSRTSNFDISEGQLGNGTSPKELAVPPAPPISAVAAGMLPSNNNTPFNSSGTGTVTHASSTGSPRVGTWVDPKSMAAPPVPSSTMTSTTLTFDNSLKAAAHSLPQPRRRATENDVSGPRSAIPPLLSMGTSVSEDLPNTMVVPPSMTHEALAARFKEMDLVLSEQQQHRGKMLGQDRELRTNPVHQRHRTLDLRQMAMGRSRMDQDDREAEEEQERRHMYGEGASDQMTTAALAHGGMNAASVNGGDSMDGTTLTTTTLRRQELITVPAGVLSYFPSPEHSKRLETPQSISRIQGRIMTENLQGVSPSSLSGSSTSSGSFREALQSRKGGAGVENLSVVTKSKGRATLGENTFRAPTVPTGSSSSSRTLTRHARRTPSSSSSYSGYSPTSPKMSSPYTKSVRISNPQQQQQQKWSTMGESLVDELLGAVRGPLRIARRMYNFTTLGFGTVMGSGGNSTSGGYKDASDYSGSGSVSSLSSLSGVRRKTSYGRRSSYGRRTGRNSHHHKEHRHSAIELDQAGINSTLSSALNLSAGRKRASIVAATVAAEEPEIASGVGQVQVHAQDAERVVQDGKAGTAATTPNSISS